MEQVREQVKEELGKKWKEKKWTTFIFEVGECMVAGKREG